MTTLIIEVGKIAEAGSDNGKVKIPKALATLVGTFFDTIEGGEFESKFEIMDNLDGKEYDAEHVKINNTAKGMTIFSNILISLKLNEDDIIRFIKLKENNFRCEVIRKDTEEYIIWEKYCTNSIRGTERRYGII